MTNDEPGMKLKDVLLLSIVIFAFLFVSKIMGGLSDERSERTGIRDTQPQRDYSDTYEPIR